MIRQIKPIELNDDMFFDDNIKMDQITVKVNYSLELEMFELNEQTVSIHGADSNENCIIAYSGSGIIIDGYSSNPQLYPGMRVSVIGFASCGIDEKIVFVNPKSIFQVPENISLKMAALSGLGLLFINALYISRPPLGSITAVSGKWEQLLTSLLKNTGYNVVGDNTNYKVDYLYVTEKGGINENLLCENSKIIYCGTTPEFKIKKEIDTSTVLKLGADWGEPYSIDVKLKYPSGYVNNTMSKNIKTYFTLCEAKLLDETIMPMEELRIIAEEENYAVKNTEFKNIKAIHQLNVEDILKELHHSNLVIEDLEFVNIDDINKLLLGLLQGTNTIILRSKKTIHRLSGYYKDVSSRKKPITAVITKSKDYTGTTKLTEAIAAIFELIGSMPLTLTTVREKSMYTIGFEDGSIGVINLIDSNINIDKIELHWEGKTLLVDENNIRSFGCILSDQIKTWTDDSIIDLNGYRVKTLSQLELFQKIFQEGF